MITNQKTLTLVTLPVLALLLASCSDQAASSSGTQPPGDPTVETAEANEGTESREDDEAHSGAEESDVEVAEETELRVAVATNEPWGAYHVDYIADDIEAHGGTMELIVPNMSEVDDESLVESVPLDEADATDYDLLVVNGAEEWPAEVVREFENLPVMASSTAYLRAEEAPYAKEIRPRLTAATASTYAEQETFAVYFGIGEDEIDVVGVPELDDTPERDPQPGTVLILTSVTHPDETGGSAPGAELLLDAADALNDEGYQILVGLHPREDKSLWEKFKIAEEGSVEASARADVAVGIPGSVFPKVAAVGTPLVGTIGPELDVPEYLTATGEMSESVDQVLTAVETAKPLSQTDLDHVVGPLGQAGPDLVAAWAAGAQMDPEDFDL